MTDRDQKASPNAIRFTLGGVGVQNAASTKQQNTKTIKIKVSIIPILE